MKKSFFSLSLLLIITLATGCASTSQTPKDNTVTTNDYIDIEMSNEMNLYSPAHESVAFSINESFYHTFTDFLLTESYTFRYADYYGLDTPLDLYHTSPAQKSTTSDLLDENKKLDAKKLLSVIESNNKKQLDGGKNAVNSFYSETSKEDKTKICSMIADVINTTCTETERRQLSDTLSAMTMFNRTGSASNAYITNHLTFVYNPTMSQMYADTQSLTTDDDKDSILKSVIIHEIMHLIQHKNDDLIDENGIEVAMCRMYNIENTTPKVPVDSLWNSWILEASAELGMADYLGISTHTYAKKISYANSYNLSRFDKLTGKDSHLETIAFGDTLEDVYQKLHLTTEKDQLDFLKFMYSVEILQRDPEDFWQNYSALTGSNPTDEEKLAIRLQIRQEAIQYLSVNFYSSLAKAISEKKITDLDTVFYLMRLWEIDCHNHLEYTKRSSLESAKPFIEWHDKTQTFLLQTLADSANLSGTNLEEQYHAYCLQTQSENKVIDNCSLDLLGQHTKDYMLHLKSQYRTAYFARNKQMIQYLTVSQ